MHQVSVIYMQKKRKEKSKTQSQKWKTSTKAACKFDVYVIILEMKSCSAARPHLEVKVQTGHKHGVCEWTEGWGVQGSAGGFRMWVNKHTVRQTHAAGRAPTGGRCHCADSRFNERVWALCDLHIWKRDTSLAWRRFSWKCFFLPLDYTQKKIKFSMKRNCPELNLKNAQDTMSFLFYLVWQKDEMRQLNVNLLLLTPVNDPFYQPPLLTFIWKSWRATRKSFFFFPLGKYLKKRFRRRKNISVKKHPGRFFFICDLGKKKCEENFFFIY